MFPLGLNQQTTVTQGGDLFNYFKAQEKYVDVGSPAYLVFYNIDYSNEENLKLIPIHVVNKYNEFMNSEFE